MKKSAGTREIGLQYGEVRVVSSSSDWAVEYARARKAIVACLGELEVTIEHVGSTAVPGLSAKPIVDIGIGASTTEDIERVIDALEHGSFIYRGDKGKSGGHLFVMESAPAFRTHHIHLVLKSDPEWSNYLRFRDALVADSALRDDYARLKQSLARAHRHDRPTYTKAKATFIRRVLDTR
jgi:GrpB-like predicted nucleotidyltransferase (UPF0157 family)